MVTPRRFKKVSGSGGSPLTQEELDEKDKASTQRRLSLTIPGFKFGKISNRLSHDISTAINDVSEESSKDMNDDDLGKSRYMMKSIVGLLTAASVYAGIDEEHGSDDLGQELSEDDLKDNESDGNENINQNYEGDDNNKPDSKSENTVQREKPNSSPKLPSALPHLETRKPTLFDFSVVPNSKVLEASSASQSVKEGARSQVKNILVNKLLKHFNLYHSDSILKEFSGWLLKDVLLQGKVFLTSRHLLFFAYLPKSPGTVKINGTLTIKSSVRGSTRYWCILKDHTLSLYNSPVEVYFPVLTIDLRNAISIKVESKSKDDEARNFRIATNEKSYTFQADSEQSAKAWANSLKKQLFAARNAKNNSVSLKIPLANIIDLDDQTIMKQTFTLRIKALESYNTFAIDDFFFVFMDGSGSALKASVLKQISVLERAGVRNVYNSSKFDLSFSSTSHKTDGVDVQNSKLQTSQNIKNKVISEEISPNLKNNQHNNKIKGKTSWWSGSKLIHSADELSTSQDDDETNNKEENSDVTESSFGINEDEDDENEKSGDKLNSESRRARIAGWTAKPFKHVAEMWSGNPIHYRNEHVAFSDDDPYLVSDKDVSPANERFRQHFKVDDNQTLISSYFTYLTRNLPLYGKLYVGKDTLCFRTLLPRVHTKMILPLSDIETCYKEKGFRFGYFGLVIVIRGHEELFFEFSTDSARGDLEYIILKQLDSKKTDRKQLLSPRASLMETDTNNAKLKLFEDKINSEGFDVPILIDENPFFQTNIIPNRSYKIGMLTIGSRGDVQPYVALGKGLIKEGHQVTIITHGEFRDFVESHNIGFKEIAGNPAELMSLMVEHESMNVGLLRDASSRFRDWITDLLDTSWKTCSSLGLDILIESPSAMAGIHIAEALQIPYFRAFTMPWTRTRAYPHAFIVPDQKRGGNYNYLTHVLFENIFWKGISGQINKWRIETLGLEKTNLDLLQQSKVPFFYNISPTIFPPSVDFSEWIKVTGYWFLDEKVDYKPSNELSKFISDAKLQGKKIVYIGFGSIVVSNAKEMTQAIVDAVLEAGIFCILNKGWSERLEDKNAKRVEIQLPDCIFNAGNVPHDWLFPQMDAAVHHGGSGTTGASLRAGLPTVIKPFFGDQFFYALRVEDIGVGIALKNLNSTTLATALKEVTNNKRIQDKALLIKEQISNEDGVKTAINCLYGELVYARGLVESKRKKTNEPCHSFKKIISDCENTETDGTWTLL